MAVDLSTTYLGMRLENPLIASACPLTSTLESLEGLRQAGVAAAVLPSLFEEQVEHDELELARLLDFWALSSPESPSYFPELNTYNTGPGDYLDLIADARRRLDMPIVASLNGNSAGGWLRYAGLIEQAGASALELNIYHVPLDGSEDAAAVERRYAHVVRELRAEVRLPLAVKVGPFFSAPVALARQLVQAGANGLVLFNRYLAPDIDLETLKYVPALELSRPEELRLVLRWLAAMRDQLETTLVATGGVHTAADVIKALLAGADAVALASTVLIHGPAHITHMLDEFKGWLEQHKYLSVQQMRGSMSLQHCSNPEGLQRANYMRALTSYTPSQTLR